MPGCQLIWLPDSLGTEHLFFFFWLFHALPILAHTWAALRSLSTHLLCVFNIHGRVSETCKENPAFRGTGAILYGIVTIVHTLRPTWCIPIILWHNTDLHTLLISFWDFIIIIVPHVTATNVISMGLFSCSNSFYKCFPHCYHSLMVGLDQVIRNAPLISTRGIVHYEFAPHGSICAIIQHFTPHWSFCHALCNILCSMSAVFPSDRKALADWMCYAISIHLLCFYFQFHCTLPMFCESFRFPILWLCFLVYKAWYFTMSKGDRAFRWFSAASNILFILLHGLSAAQNYHSDTSHKFVTCMHLWCYQLNVVRPYIILSTTLCNSAWLTCPTLLSFYDTIFHSFTISALSPYRLPVSEIFANRHVLVIACKTCAPCIPFVL